jgi:predicted NAD/FAD-binding protein
MIEGNSSIYLDALVKSCPSTRFEMNTSVTSVGRDKQGLWLETNNDKEYFDHIILATSAVISRQILGNNACQEELDILNCFETVTNKVVLHSDISVKSSEEESTIQIIDEHDSLCLNDVPLGQLITTPATIWSVLVKLWNEFRSPAG